MTSKEHVPSMLEGTGAELGRIGYVAVTRARNLFVLAVPENCLAELEPLLKGKGFENHLDICPGIRCFSFHIYDNDRDGRRALMRGVISALADGAIKPAISARFKLTEVRKAHALIEQGSALGKIIMTS